MNHDDHASWDEDYCDTCQRVWEKLATGEKGCPVCDVPECTVCGEPVDVDPMLVEEPACKTCTHCYDCNAPIKPGDELCGDCMDKRVEATGGYSDEI